MAWYSGIFDTNYKDSFPVQGLDSAFKMGAKDPSIMTKKEVDPLKQAVASPLSAFLASNIGKGLEGAPTISGDATNRYNEFMKLNANDLFDKYVANPATTAFKRDFIPLQEEGYAGSLRGSGRYRNTEDIINKFSEDMSGLRYTANKELPIAQFDMAKAKYMIDYTNWWSSLPENNPVLTQAMNFLSEGTSSGTTILSALDPGKKGWFGELLNAGAQVAAASIK